MITMEYEWMNGSRSVMWYLPFRRRRWQRRHKPETKIHSMRWKQWERWHVKSKNINNVANVQPNVTVTITIRYVRDDRDATIFICTLCHQCIMLVDDGTFVHFACAHRRQFSAQSNIVEAICYERNGTNATRSESRLSAHSECHRKISFNFYMFSSLLLRWIRTQM